jgi:restriction endonuclease S subunit
MTIGVGDMSENGWTKIRFDEFAERVNETIMPAESGFNRFIGPEHIDRLDLTIRRWDEDRNLTGKKLIVRKGDIIIAKRRWYLRRVGIAPFDALCSAHTFIVRPKVGVIHPDFLRYFLLSDQFFKKALAISVGSLSPTINWGTLKSTTFLLPPIKQQEKMSEIFSAMSTVLDCHLSALSNAEITFQKICNISFRNGSITEKLGNLAILIKDGFHNVPPRSDEGYPVIGAGDIDGHHITIQQDCRRCSVADFEAYHKSNKPEEGDLLLGIVASIGNPTILTKNVGEIALQRSVAYIRIPDEEIKQLVRYYFFSDYGRRELLSYRKQTAQAGVYLVDLAKVAINLPPPAIRKQLLSAFIEVENIVQSIKSNISYVRNLQSSILQKLMEVSE